MPLNINEPSYPQMLPQTEQTLAVEHPYAGNSQGGNIQILSPNFMLLVILDYTQ